MSHFSVIVVGPDHEKQLAPYHEFECTGRDDEFVVEVTEDIAPYRESYEAATHTWLRAPGGALHDPFDEAGNWKPEFSKENADKPFNRRELFVPPGFHQVERPVKEYETFAQWLSDYTGKPLLGWDSQPNDECKYGHIKLNYLGEVVKVVDRTNPRAKWDWYQVGGRWTGYFKLKNGAAGTLGKSGVFDNKPEAGHADVVRLGDVDIDGMRQDAAADAAKRFDLLKACLDQAGVTEDDMRATKSWEDCRAEHSDNPAAAREAYHAQPAVKAKQADSELVWYDIESFKLLPFTSFDAARNQYVAAAANNALTPFAVVKGGKWYERGSMGWWGCVSDEKDKSTWTDEFNKLIDGLPPETLLTLIDAHI